MKTLSYKVWCEYTINGTEYKDMAGPENWFLLSQSGNIMAHSPLYGIDHNVTDQYDVLIPLFVLGINDNENTPIYEGDIMEFGNGDRCVIHKVDNEWCIECIGSCECDDQWRDLYRLGNAKIIGNEYENKELLTKTQ